MAQHQVKFSVNGQSQVPPGFRFHPTEEELLVYYLRKKMASENIDLDVIREVDLNKLEPWDIQDKCKIGSAPQNDWYFFSHKDKKYPTGTRTNRATLAGFWKATGRDKVICSNSRRIGMRKTLVFYKGRAPHGVKSDWIIHEYRLQLDGNCQGPTTVPTPAGVVGESTNSEEGWVVCRLFKKRNYHKAVECYPNSCTSIHSTTDLVSNQEVLDGILVNMKRSGNHGGGGGGASTDIFLTQFDSMEFNHLPRLDGPTMTFMQENDSSSNNIPKERESYHNVYLDGSGNKTTAGMDAHVPKDWATFDRMVASQLNGQMESYCSYMYDDEFWTSGILSSSEPVSHLSDQNPPNY